MNQKQKLILSGFAVIWIILIVWGIIKANKSPSQETLPALGSAAQKTETFKGTKDPRPGSRTLAGTDAETPEEIQPPMLARTFRVKKIDFSDSLAVMGTVKAKAEYPLKFEVQGVIQKINFREGDFIKEGNLIASLDPTSSQLKLEYLKSKLLSVEKKFEALKKKLEVYQQLYEAEALIKTKLEEVELEVESAKAELNAARSEKEIAEEEIKKSYLYAATDGVMGQKEAEEGEFMTPQNELGTFFDTAELFVEVGIVERDSSKVRAGQRARISVDAFPDKNFEGILERIYPVVEGKSRTLTARIKITDPVKQLLPGMFCRVEILSVELKDALMVPSVALLNVAPGLFILPVISSSTIIEEEEGTKVGFIEERNVKVGYLGSDYSQILDNLYEDDLIVTEIKGDFVDGAKVRITGVEEFEL